MKDWKNFWQTYRLIKIKNKKDLLYQVGKTVNGKVISDKQLNLDIDEIKNNLQLNKNDVLLDLCCGNGVISYKLSNNVKSVIGVDFSKIYIENANKYNLNNNINYFNLDVLDSEELKVLLVKYPITKVLMNDCLAYFNPVSLEKVIKMLSNYKVNILLTSVLDKKKKWEYYNTFIRKINYFIDTYLLNKKSGLGYWWNKSEIVKLANKYNFKINFFKHHKLNHTAHYRFNVNLKK